MQGGSQGAAALNPHIVIAGAGSIGCFTGGFLAAAGHPVTLLARPRIIVQIRENGLTLSGYDGASRHVDADQLTLSEDPACLAGADLILVTVKTGATAQMAALIAQHAAQLTPVVSLQNGLQACEFLRAGLPGRDVRAAMVPFNVVPQGDGHYHRATSGDIVIESGPTGLASLLSTPDLMIRETPDITALQWGKLVLNLNNAVNALSGLTLHDQLMDRDWRRLMADQMAEALGVLAAARITVTSTTPLPAWMGPHILRLPTPLFSRIAAQMLTIDPAARTSMAYDLMARRPTEIDSLQGAIIALGQAHGVATPICDHLATLIHDAENAGQGMPHLRPQNLHPV